MTEKLSMSEWQSRIKQMQADFALKHKYMIAGKVDAIFEFIAKGINNDKNFDSFKRARVDEAIRLHQIDVSSAADDEKQKSTGQAKLDFAAKSLRALKEVARSGDAKAIAMAAMNISIELKDAVQSYTTGMATNPDAVKDPKFLAAAQQAAEDLRNLINAEKPRLAAVHVLYSVESVKTLRAVDDIKSMIATALAPPATDADTVPVDTDSTVDISA